jgi:hypothetical protein
MLFPSGDVDTRWQISGQKIVAAMAKSEVPGK